MPERNHIRVCGMEIGMLIIEGNSVYEIDEECVRKRKVPEKMPDGTEIADAEKTGCGERPREKERTLE